MTAATKHVAHFHITGEDMTRIARERLLEDEPGHAFRILSQGLIGEGATEASIQILKGESDLVGDSRVGLDLVRAKKNSALKAFKKRVRYLYAGRIKRGGVWRRPVAYVTELSTDDAEYASTRSSEGSRLSDLHWHRYRALYYAGHDAHAEILDLPGHDSVWVIFETCSERPYWDTPPLDEKEALAEALAAGRTLEHRKPASPESLPEPIRALRDEEEEDRDEEAREAAWKAKLEQIGNDVRARAGSDTFELALEGGRTLTIPRAPFVRWALSRTDFADTAPPWENVAESGLKMTLDNPDHTDWVLGAGLTFEEAYQDAVSGPAWQLAFELQEEAREAAKPKRKFAGIFAAIDELHNARHEAAVIIDAGECTGVVGVDIMVFPDSQSDRVAAASSCKGIVVEQGGPLAHLIIVARGQKITVMRHPNACEVFKPGMTVSLSPAAGRITVIDKSAESDP